MTITSDGCSPHLQSAAHCVSPLNPTCATPAGASVAGRSWRRMDAAASARPLPRRKRPVAGWPALQAVVFDMGDVLYDATVWRRWLLKLLGQMGLHTQYRTFFEVWDREYLEDVHRGQREYREAFEAFLRAAGLSRAQIDEVEAASQPRRRELESCVRPLPGVDRTLAALGRRGLKLGVLSDSERTAAQLEQFLDRLGLAKRFVAVVSSFDLASVKPAELNYRTICAALNVAANEAAFVGHDQEELDGAVTAGMRSVAFNADATAVADVCLGPFGELLDVAARWGAATAPVAVG